MVDREMLIAAFAFNLDIVKAQTAGLTHADSLLQPPFRGNCLNWVLGHLVDSRDGVLKALGRPPMLSDEQAARYGYGSEPVTCEEAGVMRMEDLLAALERAQAGIAEGLRQATPEALAQEIQFAGRTMRVSEKIFFLYFHDTYHVGQTELLRQLAGTNDKVI